MNIQTKFLLLYLKPKKKCRILSQTQTEKLIKFNGKFSYVTPNKYFIVLFTNSYSKTMIKFSHKEESLPTKFQLIDKIKLLCQIITLLWENPRRSWCNSTTLYIKNKNEWNLKNSAYKLISDFII